MPIKTSAAKTVANKTVANKTVANKTVANKSVARWTAEDAVTTLKDKRQWVKDISLCLFPFVSKMTTAPSVKLYKEVTVRYPKGENNRFGKPM